MNEIFSVGIVSYKNYQHLYEAIDSVLWQTYPKIELILSDDGSPKFPYEQIADYVNNKKKANIVNLVIRKEPTNVGTVKHLNHIIDIAHGEFMIFLACDDALYNKDVLSTYVQSFENLSPECMLQFSQTAMYDSTLDNLEYYYLQPAIIAMLQEKDYRSLHLALLTYPYLPATSTCFKKSFFDTYGKFNEKYKLIEDLPLHQKIAKERIPVNYENFISVKHRHGGVSHSDGKVTKTKALYYYDSINILRNNVKELKKYPSKDSGLILSKTYKSLLWLELVLLKSNPTLKNIIIFAYHWPSFISALFFKKIGTQRRIYSSMTLILTGLLGLLILPEFTRVLLKIFPATPDAIAEVLHMITLLMVCGGLLLLPVSWMGFVLNAIDTFPSAVIHFDYSRKNG